MTSPNKRYSHYICFDNVRNVMVLFGGYSYSEKCLDDTWELDLRTKNWKEVTPKVSPSPRNAHAMAYDTARGNVVLFGGSIANSGNHDDYVNDTWLWNGIIWTLTITLNAPSKRTAHTMAYDAKRKKVVLFGGLDRGGDLNDTWLWDGVNWTELRKS